MKATLWLLGIITAVFLLQLAEPSVTEQFKLVAADAAERPWILLTSIFLHGGVVHLLYNGFGLFMFGSILENELGVKRYLLVFFASGMAASIAAALFYPASLGASGAIFGIIGAVAILRPMLTVWAYSIPMPMFLAAAAWAVGDMIGIALPGNVANAAHLAGLAMGIALGFLVRKPKPRILNEPPAVTKHDIEAWERQYMPGQK